MGTAINAPFSGGLVMVFMKRPWGYPLFSMQFLNRTLLR